MKVTFTASDKEVSWDEKQENILAFAESVGLEPPFGCRAGRCGRCESTLAEGEIAYNHEHLFEPEEGNILLCCSRPVTDVRIER